MAEGEQPDESQKTEEPTPKKLQDSRKKGQVALSREINNWVMLLMASLIAIGVSPLMMDALFQYLALFIEKPHEFHGGTLGMAIILKESFFQTVAALMLPFILLMIAGFLGPFLQVGPLFAPETIKPSLEKISIMKGFKRIFSLRAVVEFVKGIFKLVVVGLVTAAIIYPFLDGIEHMIDLPIPYVMDEILGLVARVMIGILVVLLIVAVFDYAYQRAEHYKKMRMTKQEVKDEYKTTEGDPQIKAKLRQLRMQKSRQQVLQNVAMADVVIMNPTHYAVALQYDPDESPAPICVGKGLNETALRIRAIAEENGIVVEENPPLARALYDSVDVDEMIPLEHYEAVAKIISYVFQKKKKI